MVVSSHYLAAVTARLDRVAAGDGVSAVLEPDALVEARMLAENCTEEDGDALNALGWLYWYRYQGSPEGSGENDLAVAWNMFAVCFARGFGDVPAPLVRALAAEAAPVATGILQEIDDIADPDFSALVGIWQRIVAGTPAGDPARVGYLSNLCAALQMRAARDGALGDLEDAIEAGREALNEAPAGSPDRYAVLNNLAFVLEMRFDQTARPAHLDELIHIRALAAESVADQPRAHTDTLTKLANALSSRYNLAQRQEDLDAIIATQETASAACEPGDPKRSVVLLNLASARQEQFRRSGDDSDLGAAINALEAARDTHLGAAQLPVILSDLCGLLAQRVSRTEALADLEAYVAGLRALLDVLPDAADRGTVQASLASALMARYRLTGAREDLDKAIAAYWAAVGDRPEDHPHRLDYLEELGEALLLRFNDRGLPADLDSLPLADLAALTGGFRLRGTEADLNSAIEVHRWWADAAPADHPRRPALLSDLGSLLSIRADRVGSEADLDAGIDILSAVAEGGRLTESGQVRVLSSLSVALRRRFERRGNVADLDAAIENGTRGLAILPDHDQGRWWPCFSHAGVALGLRFERSRADADLEAAVAAHRVAVMSRPH